MPMINIDLFVPPKPDVRNDIAAVAQASAVEWLHFVPANTIVNIRVLGAGDAWYIGGQALDRATQPSFQVVAYPGAKMATDLEMRHFVSETSQRIKEIMVAAFPRTDFPDFGDRSKVMVLVMA